MELGTLDKVDPPHNVLHESCVLNKTFVVEFNYLI